MLAWINFAVLLLSSLLFLLFYVLSVSPAAMGRVIGPQAYRKCAAYRVIAIFFEFITIANYVLYRFYPLPTPLPPKFPWPYWISALIGVLVGVPSFYLMIKGMVDAGEEAVRPKEEHTLYSGLYEKIRHPQALGEVFLWHVIAFFLNSPFLVIFSFIFFPLFLIMCWAEEHDLIMRYGDPYVDYIKRTGSFWPKRQSQAPGSGD